MGFFLFRPLVCLFVFVVCCLFVCCLFVVCCCCLFVCLFLID